MNKLQKEKEKLALNIINSKIKEYYFKPYKKGIFYKQISDYFSVLIYFEFSDRRKNETLYINPIVGVYNKVVELIFFDIMNGLYKTSETMPNTALKSLGYLLPENDYKTWDFTIYDDQERIKKILDNLLSEFIKNVLPYLASLQNNDKLIYALENVNIGYVLKANYFKIAILYYLEGKHSEANTLCQKVLILERPTPKNLGVEEPEFKSYEEALDYFKPNKDIRFYYCFKYFYKEFREQYLFKPKE